MNNLYERVAQALMMAMDANRDALTTDTYLLWVAHNLERIADRAKNVCERVIFIATGERVLPEVAVAS